jgi:DHA1 family tetracycline resistance protein-like MFS transporter
VTSSPTKPHGAPHPAAFSFIFATVLLDMLTIGIIVPVLPTLIVEFANGDMKGAAEIYGLFGTAWALMQFVFSPIQGALSDRFGRRAVILISNLGVGLDYVLMALAPTLAWLFVGRMISGVASRRRTPMSPTSYSEWPRPASASGSASRCLRSGASRARPRSG